MIHHQIWSYQHLESYGDFKVFKSKKKILKKQENLIYPTL